MLFCVGVFEMVSVNVCSGVGWVCLVNGSFWSGGVCNSGLCCGWGERICGCDEWIWIEMLLRCGGSKGVWLGCVEWLSGWWVNVRDDVCGIWMLRSVLTWECGCGLFLWWGWRVSW